MTRARRARRVLFGGLVAAQPLLPGPEGRRIAATPGVVGLMLVTSLAESVAAGPLQGGRGS